jgi:hypothetical protein
MLSYPTVRGHRHRRARVKDARLVSRAIGFDSDLGYLFLLSEQAPHFSHRRGGARRRSFDRSTRPASAAAIHKHTTLKQPENALNLERYS